MKEITRIHLAKISYDIEVEAKKNLEKYVNSLEVYTQDEDVLSDIEIRMTEILAERSVKAGGVISSADVEAIRSQLGEPHEFADEGGDMAVGADKGSLDNRRYYRDLDGAVLGGVLSGVALYFGFNPLWSRLAFILLIFISWGAALLVYVVLWIVVPPARTAAERLQLTGKPVNLATIRELNELQGDGVNKVSRFVREFLRISLGLASVLGAVVSFVATVWGSVGLTLRTSDESYLSNLIPGDEATSWIIYILAVVSGVLLTLFFSVLSYAILKRDWSKKVAILLVGIVAAGIITSTSAVTTGVFASINQGNQARESVKQTTRTLPAEFSKTKKLTVFTGIAMQGYGDYENVSFNYVVDEKRREYQLEAPEGITPNIQIDGESTRISIRVPQNIQYYTVPKLTVYGPAINELFVERGSVAYYSQKQEEIKVDSLDSSVEIRGEYGTVHSTGTGRVSLNEATIENAVVEAKPGGLVTIGVVRSLTLTQPDICPSSGDYWQSRVSVISVSSGVFTYNGQESKLESRNSYCSLFVIGEEEDLYEEYNYEERY